MPQVRSSKNTAQHLGVNGIYKFIPSTTRTVFDYGCGPYDDNEFYCRRRGLIWYGYDPNHRGQSVNSLFFTAWERDPVDVIICSNVLNVIDSLDEVYNILRRIRQHTRPNTLVLFAFYERDKSNVGVESQHDCWQRNETMAVWMGRVKETGFKILKKQGSYLICRGA